MTGSPKIQPGSTLRLDRLRANALARQEPGLQIPKDESALEVIAKASDGLPSKEEQRFMWARLVQTIDGILGALPEGLAERGKLSTPPLVVPSKIELMDSPARIEALLTELHKHVPWHFVAPAHKYEWRLFREQMGLLVKLCEDVALGKMSTLSKDEYHVKLRALDQLSQSVVLYGECFREAVKFIPVPELPPPLAEKGPERFGSAVISRLIQAGLLAAAGCKAGFEAVWNVFSNYISPAIKAVVSPIKKAMRDAVAATSEVVREALKATVVVALLGAGVAVVGWQVWSDPLASIGFVVGLGAAVSIGLVTLRWLHERYEDAAEARSNRKSSAPSGEEFSGLASWKRFAWAKFDWRKSLRDSLVRAGISNVASYAKIRSNDPGFADANVVLNVLVPVDNAGTLRSLNELIPAKSSGAPDKTLTPADVLFTERTFDSNYPYASPAQGQTFIRFPAITGLHPYPFPAHSELVGVRLLSRKEKLIDMSRPVNSRWGVFGGVELDCPPDVEFVEVCFETKPNKPIPEEVLKALEKSLPDIDNFAGQEAEALRTALSAVNLPSDSAHSLVLQHQYMRGLNVGPGKTSAIADKLVAAAGTSVNEMVAGLRRGSTEAVGLYLSSLLRTHGAVAGLATVIPQSSEELHPAKSQQVLQRLTPEGLSWEDVRSARELGRDVVTPDLLQSMRVVGAVASMPSREVYNYATQVDAVLSGRRSFDVFLSQLRGTIATFIWGKPSERFQGDYDFTPFLPEQRFDSAPEQLRGPLRAVSAVATAITFEQLAKQARRGGDLASVLRGLDANSGHAQLSEQDRSLISESYRELGSFNPRTTGLALIGELVDLNSSRGNEPGLVEIWKWIGARLPNMYQRGVTTSFNGPFIRDESYAAKAQEDRQTREKGVLGGELSVDEAIELTSGNRVKTLPTGFIEPFIHAFTALPVLEHGFADPANHAAQPMTAENIRAIAQILDVAVSRLTSAPTQITEDSFRAILNQVAAIADWGDAIFSSEAECDQLRSALVGAVSKLGSKVNGSSIGAFFELIHTNRADQRERVTRLFKGQDLSRGLGFTSTAKGQRRAALESLSYSISKSLTAAPLSAQDADVWENSLSCLARVGIKPSELPGRVRILSIVRQDLARMHKKDPTFINLPSEETPASRLVAEMTEGTAVKALSVLGRLVDGGLISNQELESAWPAVDEAKVAQLFWNLTYLNSSSEGLELKVNRSRIAPGKNSSIQVDRIPWLSKVLMQADSAALPLVFFNREVSGAHWAELDLREVWERYPQHRPQEVAQKGLVQGIAKGAMTRLVEGFDAEAVYRAHAWLATCMNTESGRTAATRATRLADLFRFGKQQQFIFRDLRALVESLQVGAGSFGELAVELKTRMLLAGTLLFSHDRHPLAARRSITDRKLSTEIQPSKTPLESTEGARTALSSGKGISQRLLRPLYAAELPPRKLPAASVWTALYTEPSTSSINMDSLLSVIRGRVDLIRREFKDAWPRYLQSRVGRIVVPTTGGDIRELREYSLGDDFRRIVWAASQRSGKLIVRTNEETESRNYTFIVDLDHLAQDFLRAKESAQSDVTKASALIDLMTALELVRHENLSADVVLYGRSFVESISDIVKARKGAQVGELDKKAIKEVLLPKVCAAVKMLAAEAQIKVDSTKSLSEVNPFESSDLRHDNRRIHILIGGEANKGFYRRALDSFVRRGMAAVSFITKPTPTEEEKEDSQGEDDDES